MLRILHALPAAGAAAALLGSAPTGDVQLRALLRAGDVTTSRSILQIELEQTDGTFLTDGEDGFEHDARRRMGLTQLLEWTDTVRSTAGPRVTALRRELHEVSGGVALERVGEPLAARDGESELTGRTVSFEWDAKERCYRRAFARRSPDDEARKEALEGLAAIVDFAGLLPGGKVGTRTAVGDRWDVEPGAIGAALLPLGRVQIGADEDHRTLYGAYTGFTSPVLPPVPGRWFDAPDFGKPGGTVVAALAAVESTDRGPLATIEIEARIELDAEFPGWLRRFDLGPNFDPDVEALGLEGRLDGTGVLVWDVERGCAVGWSFDGELRVEFEARWALEQRGQRYEFEASQRLEGSVHSKIESSRRP